jgi:hypothetical protein
MFELYILGREVDNKSSGVYVEAFEDSSITNETRDG